MCILSLGRFLCNGVGDSSDRIRGKWRVRFVLEHDCTSTRTDCEENRVCRFGCGTRFQRVHQVRIISKFGLCSCELYIDRFLFFKRPKEGDQSGIEGGAVPVLAPPPKSPQNTAYVDTSPRFNPFDKSGSAQDAIPTTETVQPEITRTDSQVFYLYYDLSWDERYIFITSVRISGNSSDTSVRRGC